MTIGATRTGLGIRKVNWREPFLVAACVAEVLTVNGESGQWFHCIVEYEKASLVNCVTTDRWTWLIR